MTRLVCQQAKTGRIEDRRGRPPSRRVERKYTAGDIRLLAEVDTTLGQMSGPATRAVMWRECQVPGNGPFERLSRLPVSFVQLAAVGDLPRAEPLSNTPRRPPFAPASGSVRCPCKPGHARVDTVH
ncbi:MAG: hypothetical protein OXS50_01740 [Gammaproteobacteria bacterium]|nr:hypothetical protein [Gammaproteobacteria bacterium]